MAVPEVAHSLKSYPSRVLEPFSGQLGQVQVFILQHKAAQKKNVLGYSRILGESRLLPVSGIILRREMLPLLFFIASLSALMFSFFVASHYISANLFSTLGKKTKPFNLLGYARYKVILPWVHTVCLSPVSNL